MAQNRAINYRELKAQVDKNGRRWAAQHLTEAMDPKRANRLRPEDFSIRELAEAFMGREWVENLHPKRGRFVGLQEADTTAVSYTSFSNITGQIYFNAILEAYDQEDFVFSKIIPTKPTDLQDTEKIAGITGIGNEAEVVGENDPYPMVGVSENYIEVGAKQKRGHIVPVTKEAIFGDRTGLLLDRCKQVGYWLGYNREIRLIDVFLDENTGATSIVNGGHRYHWRGTSYATYQASTPWVNIKTSNGLYDYTSVAAAWLLLANMVDPFTGAPIMVQPDSIIVTPDKYWDAVRILHMTEVKSIVGGYATSGTPVQSGGPNPINFVLPSMNLITSRLLKQRAATDTDWWVGNPRRAFAYFSNWDITPEESPSGSSEAFHRDVVLQLKASEKGTAATMEPRLMVENQQ